MSMTSSSFQPDFTPDETPRVRRNGPFRSSRKREVNTSHSTADSESQSSRFNGFSRGGWGPAFDHTNGNGNGNSYDKSKQPFDGQQFGDQNFDEQQLEEHSFEQFSEPQQQVIGQEAREQEVAEGFTEQASNEQEADETQRPIEQEFSEDQFDDYAFQQRKLAHEAIRNQHARQLDTSSSDDSDDEDSLHYHRRAARGGKKDPVKTRLNIMIDQEMQEERRRRIYPMEIPEDPDVPASAWNRNSAGNGEWDRSRNQEQRKESTEGSAHSSRATTMATAVPTSETTGDLDVGGGWSEGPGADDEKARLSQQRSRRMPSRHAPQQHVSHVPSGPGLIRVQPTRPTDSQPPRPSGVRMENGLQTAITGPAVEALARSMPPSPNANGTEARKPVPQSNGVAGRNPPNGTSRDNVSWPNEQLPQHSPERRPDWGQKVQSKQEQTQGAAASRQTANSNTTSVPATGFVESTSRSKEVKIQVDLNVDLESFVKAKITGDIKFTFS